MKKTILLAAACLLLNSFQLQAQGDDLQKQINEQVWKPFIKAYNELDTEKFMAVHSKEVTRVIQDGDMIYGYDIYYQNNKNNNERSKQSLQKNNGKRVIELRFTQRIAGNDRAFEVGYYKVTTTTGNDSARNYYGKFHVLLRKENGIWKILMDADAHENTTEELFMTGKPVE